MYSRHLLDEMNELSLANLKELVCVEHTESGLQEVKKVYWKW